MTHQEIIDDYPDLTEEDILACSAYAADKERHLDPNYWNDFEAFTDLNDSD